MQKTLKGLHEQANLNQGELVHYCLYSTVNSFKFRSCSAFDDDIHALPKYIQFNTLEFFKLMHA